MKNERNVSPVSAHAFPNFQVSILNLFVTFVSYLKEYGRAGTDIIVEAG